MFFMISDRDIKKIKKELAKDFVTKQEFKRGIESSNNYTEKLFISLSKDLLDFKKEMVEFKEQTYKTLDRLVGAFKKFDEEHTILSTRYSTINKTLDNHEQRITLIENKN